MKKPSIFALVAAGVIALSGTAIAGEGRDKPEKERDSATEAPQHVLELDMLAGNDADAKEKDKEKDKSRPEDSQYRELIDAHRAV